MNTVKRTLLAFATLGVLLGVVGCEQNYPSGQGQGQQEQQGTEHSQPQQGGGMDQGTQQSPDQGSGTQ